MKIPKISLFILIFLIFAQLSFAQGEVDGGYSSGIERPGFDTNKPYFGAGFGTNVNLFSGSISVQGVATSLPGRNDLNINFQPSYSSASVLLNQEEGTQNYNIKDHGPLGLGWEGWHFGRVRVVSSSNDHFVIPEFVVEESDGSTLPFLVDTESPEDRFVDVDLGSGQKYPGIMLSDGSRIIIFNGNCPVYYRADEIFGLCNGGRLDLGTGNWKEAAQWGKIRIVRVLQDGTRITYGHFVGPVIDTDPNIVGSQRTWWTNTVGLPDYSDFSDGVNNKAFQNYLPGYYVTRVEDTNGNYIDFSYYNEKKCVDNANLNLYCYSPLGAQTTYDPLTFNQNNPEYLKENLVYHRSASTFGSPYVKEIRIQPYACNGENTPGICSSGNSDYVSYKSSRKIKFVYDNVNIKNAKLLKVIYPASSITSTRGEISIRYTYQNIATGYNHFLLKTARIYDETNNQPLFAESKYNYDTDGGFDLYHLKSIESPLGGKFEIEYNRKGITSYCSSNLCPRNVNVVSRTLVKENPDDLTPLITEYYYENYQDYDPLVSPGTRKTYVVQPAENNNHRTISVATYIMPYGWESDYNWKSGLMLKEEVYDAFSYIPGTDSYSFQISGDVVKTKDYFYDSVLVGKGKKFKDSLPNGKFYYVRKPLQEGVMSCDYDENNLNNKRCAFDEYVYYGEHSIQNVPSQGGWIELGYNDVITYTGISKNFYDGHYGLVKDTIHYGEVTNVYKNYYSNIWGGVESMGFASKMHGTLTIGNINSGDDTKETYYYQHRKPGSAGKYFGYIGQQTCFSSGLCWNAGEFGLPEFQAVNYPYKVELKEVSSGKMLRSEETIYDELHYPGEDETKLFGVQMFRKYAHEPQTKFTNAAPISNSVPNMNPTTTTIKIYNDQGQVIQERKTSFKKEKTKSSSTPYSYIGDVPSYIGVGNTYKIRNPDWQDAPIDDYFSDNSFGKGVVTLKYDGSGFFLESQKEWIFPQVDDINSDNYLTGQYKEKEIYERNYHDAVTGTVYAIEDASRNYIRYWYDKLGRITASGVFEDNPDNQASEWQTRSINDASLIYDYYDDNPSAGYPFAVEVKQKRSKVGGIVNYYNPVTNYYDGLGRLIQTRQKYDEDTDLVVDVTYDEQGNKYEETIRPYLDSSSSSRVINTVRDIVLGNDDVKQSNIKSGGAGEINSAEGVVVRYEDYDALNRIKEVWPYGNSEEKIINIYGDDYLESVNEKGIKSESYFDGFGRVTRIVEDADNVDSSKKITTQYRYNNLGQTILVTDGNDLGKQTSYRYNSAGQILEVNNPDSGIQTNLYDKAGRLKSSTDANDVKTVNRYDSLGRPIKLVYLIEGTQVDNTLTKTFEYKLTPKTNSYDYEGYPNYETLCNGIGKLTAVNVVDASANTNEPIDIRTEYCYDYEGRLIFENQNIAGNTFFIGYEYDDSSKLIKEYYPKGDIVDYNYNDLGQLDNVKLNGDDVAGYTYYPKGTIESSTYGNGVTTVYTYTPKDYVESITSRNSDSSLIYQRSYDYDETGNLISLFGPGNTLVASYNYDNHDRLINVNDNGYYGTDITYQYDKVGNRMILTTNYKNQEYKYYHTDGSLKDANLAGTNRLAEVDGDTYTYDARGNLLTKSSVYGIGSNVETYEYSSSNMLAKIKNSINSDESKVSSLFIYDIFGNRVINKEDSRIKEFDDTNEISAITLGKNSEVYVVRDLGANIEVTKCDRFLAECNVLDGFTGITGVLDIYYNDYLGLLYLLLDNGINVNYYTCEEDLCTNVDSRVIGSSTSLTGYAIPPVRNLVSNPSFEVNEFQEGIHFVDHENGTGVFLGVPEIWATGPENSNSYIDRISNDVYDQTYSMKVTDTSVSSPISLTYLMPITENTQYTCSAYAKVISSNSQGSENYRDGYQDIAMWFFDESKQRIDNTNYGDNCDSSEVCETARSSTWSRVSVTRTSPDNSAYVSCFVNSMIQDNGVTLWDAFQIEQGSAPTVFEGYNVKIFVTSVDGKVKRYNYGLNSLESTSAVIPGFDVLNVPLDVVTDSFGNVFVAGNGNDKIIEFNYNLNSILNQIPIDNPKYLDIDKYGFLYVIDANLNGIKINPLDNGILSQTSELDNPKGIVQDNYGIYVLDENIAGIGRVVKFADPFSFEAMYTYYIRDKLGNIIHEKQRETNLESTNAFTTFEATAQACNQIGGCSGTTEFVNGYCPATENNCVFNDQCYVNEKTANIDSSAKGYGICLAGTWNDCDKDQNTCGKCGEDLSSTGVFNGCTGINCWQPWKAENTPLKGEYSGTMGQYGCCGDDVGEFYTNTQGRTACCNAPGMFVKPNGVCSYTLGGRNVGSSPLVTKAPQDIAASYCEIDGYLNGQDCNWNGGECVCN